jgi:succinate dehydrogenase / fumarate reductase, flavoprotein subunit
LLDEGLGKLDNVIATMRSDLAVADRSMIFNTDLAEALELDNMLAQASVSLHSAVGRTESRGAHAREDFPNRDDENWLKHTLSWLDDAGDVRLDFRPVHLQPLSNDVSTIPPGKRVY